MKRLAMVAAMVAMVAMATVGSVRGDEIWVSTKAGPTFIVALIEFPQPRAVEVRVEGVSGRIVSTTDTVHLMALKPLQQGRLYKVLVTPSGGQTRTYEATTTRATEYLEQAFPNSLDYATAAERGVLSDVAERKLKGQWVDERILKRRERVRWNAQQDFEIRWLTEMLGLLGVQ